MKKHFLNLTLIAFISFGIISCKEKTEEPKEAQTVAETTKTATTFSLDTKSSLIHWKGSKPAGSHEGTLHLNSGTISVMDGEIQAGSFEIDMNSLTNTDMKAGEGKESLEGHLKGTEEGSEKDFFNVTEFPTAKFEITSIDGTGGNVTVNGNLTIKEVTQNVSFPAIVSYPADAMFLKSKSFKIDRTQWGINFMSKSVFDDLKDKFINDEIELTVELHAGKI